jgi:autotransporter-associated beta strand protein
LLHSSQFMNVIVLPCEAQWSAGLANEFADPIKRAKARQGSLLRLLLRIIAAFFVFISLVSRASTATWLDNPVSGDWNNPVNWTAGGPPNGSVDTASFGASNQTVISLSTNTEVDSVVFDNGATSYTITTGPSLTLTISGAGILRTSTYLSTLVTETTDGNSPGRGQVWFTRSASAGSYTFILNNGSASSSLSGGRAVFFDNARAGTAIITQNGPSHTGGDGGRVLFFGNASADSASITNLGGVPVTGQGDQRGQGAASFNNSSTAGDALIYNYGGDSAGAAGGVTQFLDSSSASSSGLQSFGSTKSGSSGGRIDFFDNSTADSAYLLARGGSAGGGGGAIYFRDNSVGGTSRVELRGNGFLDISAHDAPGVAIGSLQGDGNIFLGAWNLSVGGNTVGFEGVIQDGGEAGGAGGSLTKVGAETLFLYSTNTYSGGTVVKGGALYAVHDHALGSGNVTALTPGTTLAFQPFAIGASNDYIADTATLSLVSSATIKLNYDGTDTIGVLILDGVVQPPGLYGANLAPSTSQYFRSRDHKSGLIGTGKILAQSPVAVSRKAHGGSFYDVYLPLTGPPGVECRSGGGANSYQVIVRFLNKATFTGAAVTSGNAMVSNISGNGTMQATINLSGVANQQTLHITLFSLNDGLGLRDLVIPMAVLFGDTTGNGIVNSSDVSETKGHVDESLSAINFRQDITINGEIDSFDVESVKSHSGTGLSMALVSPQESPLRSRRRLPLLP